MTTKQTFPYRANVLKPIFWIVFLLSVLGGNAYFALSIEPPSLGWLVSCALLVIPIVWLAVDLYGATKFKGRLILTPTMIRVEGGGLRYKVETMSFADVTSANEESDWGVVELVLRSEAKKLTLLRWNFRNGRDYDQVKAYIKDAVDQSKG